MDLFLKSVDQIVTLHHSTANSATEQYLAFVLTLTSYTRWFQLLSLWINVSRVTVEMKATEQLYFPVVLFVLFYNVFYNVVLCMKFQRVTIHKIFSSPFLLYCWFVRYIVVPTFKSLDKILKCDHSYERWVALSSVFLFKVGYIRPV